MLHSRCLEILISRKVANVRRTLADIEALEHGKLTSECALSSFQEVCTFSQMLCRRLSAYSMIANILAASLIRILAVATVCFKLLRILTRPTEFLLAFFQTNSDSEESRREILKEQIEKMDKERYAFSKKIFRKTRYAGRFQVLIYFPAVPDAYK